VVVVELVQLVPLVAVATDHRFLLLDRPCIMLVEEAVRLTPVQSQEGLAAVDLGLVQAQLLAQPREQPTLEVVGVVQEDKTVAHQLVLQVVLVLLLLDILLDIILPLVRD
jgi:hypothetical protein